MATPIAWMSKPSSTATAMHSAIGMALPGFNPFSSKAYNGSPT